MAARVVSKSAKAPVKKAAAKPKSAAKTKLVKPTAAQTKTSSKPTNGVKAKTSSAKTSSSKPNVKRNALMNSASTTDERAAKKEELLQRARRAAAPVVAAAASSQTSIKLPGPGEIFGQAAWLMMMSQTHKHLFLSDLEWLLTPPIMLKQFRIWRNNNIPFAYASWARMNEEGEHRLLAGNRRLSPADWNNGGTVWLIDLVCPHGDPEAVLRDLKESVFADEILMTVRPDTDGKGVRAVEVKAEELRKIQKSRDAANNSSLSTQTVAE